MSKWYPSQACSPCGITANQLTCLKKYGERPLKNASEVSTMHKGFCYICERDDQYVTEMRDYFYPDIRAIRYIKNYLLKGGEL